MIGSGSQGWAATLADLSIILFMITAADLSNAGPPAPDAIEGSIVTAEAVAVYRPGAGLPSLGDWLAGQPADPRQRLTILVRHGGTSEDALLAEGLYLAREAEKAGRPARLIVEQGERADVAAILAYDSDPAAVARNLLQDNREDTTEDVR